MNEEKLQIRIHGDDSKPTLVYLPGVHGDWTLVSSFREQIKPHVRFVEFIYPRTLKWGLNDYANAVVEALANNHICEGIVLGESFGSQVAWPLLDVCLREPGPTTFRPTALILSGGFVRFPFMPLVDFTRAVWSIMPERLIRLNFWAYARIARWRHRNAPETAAAITEFIGRRTPDDLLAMHHRFKLIRGNNPADSARHVDIPVYQLTGFWDPVVNYPTVRHWLRGNCPGYQSTHVIPTADHNALGTAPEQSSEVVRRWMEELITKRDAATPPE